MKFCTKDIKICYDFQSELEKSFEKISNIKPIKKTIKYPTSANHGTGSSVYEFDYYTAGYFNTTSAVNAVQFKMASGNIDAGDICLYGIA